MTAPLSNIVRKRIAWLSDTATDAQILALWRFEPSDSEWLEGGVGDALLARYTHMRNSLDGDQWTALSKSTGWTNPYSEPSE